MILRWIYFLLSRGDIFEHSDLFISFPGSSASAIEDILPLTKVNQIALSQSNASFFDLKFILNADFQFVAYVNCESWNSLSLLKTFLQLSTHSTIVLIKWNDTLPESSIKDYFLLPMLSEDENTDKLLISTQIYVLTNSSIYEIFDRIPGKLTIRRLELDTSKIRKIIPHMSSRKNFQMNRIIASHFSKNWEAISSSSERTIMLGGNISLSYHFLGYMQDYLNFTVDIQTSLNWEDMAEEVQQKKVDIGVTPSTMNYNATKHFRFLGPPTYIDPVTIHYIPLQESSTTLVHITSFHPKIWLGIFGTLVVIIACRYVTSWPWKFSEAEPIWSILCCFCQQSCPMGISNSLRILTFTCSLFCVIIYAIYSGSLISSLSTQINSLSSIQQLIDNGYRFGIQNDSITAYTSFTIKDADSMGKIVLSNLHSTKEFQYPSLRLGIQTALSREKYALITEMSLSEVVTEFQFQKESLPHRCWPLVQLPIPLYTVYQSCITRKDSPLTNYFNLARITMKERGISNAVLLRRGNAVREQKPNCEVISEGERAFTLKDVAVPIFIMGFGIIFSFITLGAEIIYHQKQSLFATDSSGL